MKTYSIREAKQRLDQMADKALKGEYVFIVHKSKVLQLHALTPSRSTPVRPPGYFRKCYTKSEARESNRLAGRSPKKLIA